MGRSGRTDHTGWRLALHKLWTSLGESLLLLTILPRRPTKPNLSKLSTLNQSKYSAMRIPPPVAKLGWMPIKLALNTSQQRPRARTLPDVPCNEGYYFVVDTLIGVVVIDNFSKENCCLMPSLCCYCCIDWERHQLISSLTLPVSHLRHPTPVYYESFPIVSGCCSYPILVESMGTERLMCVTRFYTTQ